MPYDADFDGSLETFVKSPLGGLDRRAIAGILAENAPRVAAGDLAGARAKLRCAGASVARDACVVLLGGSNGILRAVAIQLLFGEGVAVRCVHHDSERLQIGAYHARAITAAADEAGLTCVYRNADATDERVIADVISDLKVKYRVVHLIDGIASGAPKRLPEWGPAKVRDLDVAFDPVRQMPDFSRWENVRRVGLVDVGTATEAETERTYRMMGGASLAWAERLAQANLLVPRESVVAFADYDYEADDPVYAFGPLAVAKGRQREHMRRIREAWGAVTVRLCYPPMNTTALGTIPGGCLMFAGNAEVLLRRGRYRNLAALAFESMAAFRPGFDAEELRLDGAFRAGLAEFHELARSIGTHNYQDRLATVVGSPDL
jgi:enoyl-[acyl-carrier protein] reductase/trans-2-enoyl-CoA reductase (NAD+)